jgi:putative glycosyltransferase (TIGR04348 family)
MQDRSIEPRRIASARLVVALVTPAFADANNGNWQTAKRWARMLAAEHRVELLARWGGEPADMMLALHARRSAPSIDAFAHAQPQRPLIVALTGTDLYQDLAVDASARRSIEQATRLIVLQDQAPLAVPESHRHKVDVVFQSTPARRKLHKTTQHLRAVVVGHLRAVKDPATAMRAMRLLKHRRDILMDHCGAALDDALAQQARALMSEAPAYRWLGGVTHAQALARIQRAHVLVHPSVLEGGAHVVMEAARCGTPVIASRMAGNVGMLGTTYEGYFEVGDDVGLARCLERARDDAEWLARLTQAVQARAPLFSPQAESAALRAAVSRARSDRDRAKAASTHRDCGGA